MSAVQEKKGLGQALLVNFHVQETPTLHTYEGLINGRATLRQS